MLAREEQCILATVVVVRGDEDCYICVRNHGLEEPWC